MNRDIKGGFARVEEMWPRDINFLGQKELSEGNVLAFVKVGDSSQQSAELSKRPNLCGPRTVSFLAQNMLGRPVNLEEVLIVGEKMRVIDEGGMIIKGVTRLLNKLDTEHKMTILSPKKKYRNLEYIKWLVDKGGVLVAGSWELDQNDTDEHIVTIIGYRQNGELVIADSSFRGSINPENRDFQNMGFYKMKYEDFVKRWFWSRYGFQNSEGKLMAEGGWDNLPALAVWPRRDYKEV